MEQNIKYYVVKDKAIPEVLIKVVEAKRLLTADKMMTVKEATDKCGRNITLSIQISDEMGLLSELLAVVAKYHANILTIHQTIPVSGVATISLSIEVLNDTGDLSKMVDEIGNLDGIFDIKILARE